MPPRKLDRGTFQERLLSAFIAPSFDQLRRELKGVADAACDAYSNSRKSPLTRKAGPGFADPEYELAVDWLSVLPATPSSRQKYITTREQHGFCW
jgi:hypothetical protein